MRRFARSVTSARICMGLVGLGLVWIPPAPAKETSPAALTSDQTIRHALERMGFGARPGDLERVRQMGLDRYLENQLHPESIADTDVEKKLARLRGLSLDSQTLTVLQRQSSRRTVDGKPDLAARRAYQAFTTRVLGELQMAKVVRAVESERQLKEVMVDFWTNHFNIDVRKGPNRTLKLLDDRDVIRPHALGQFRDLLGASARSPAMLFYLDNARNISPPNPATSARGGARNRGGINENYARELMELHTLGVDGGYTQKDVQEVARCLSGWGVDPQTGGFRFFAARHDNGAKSVLGESIPAGGGIHDGEIVLDILAKHPSTAKHISRKLCQRFVADDPPGSAVDRAAMAFSRSGGDIRETVRAILTSPEFQDPKCHRSKVKSPFEFVVSAVRAVGGRVVLSQEPEPALLREAASSADASKPRMSRNTVVRQGRRDGGYGARSLAGQIATLGEPLFLYQAPTGYPEASHTWLSAGGLVSRWNFALALANGQIPGVVLPDQSGPSAKTPGERVDILIRKIVGHPVSVSTRKAVLERETADDKELLGYLLGSPEFQRR